MNNKEFKTSAAQRKANERWKNNNKEKQRYYVAKSNTKRFILKEAEDKDVKEIKIWIKEREKK